MEIADRSLILVKRDLNVRSLAPFFGQDFDSNVIIFVTGVGVVIAEDLAVQDEMMAAAPGAAGSLVI